MTGSLTRRRILKRGGGMQVIRRRRSFVYDVSKGHPVNAPVFGTVVSPLKVKSAALAGATAIDLFAANLKGKIQKGSTLSIGGHVYPVASTVEATSGGTLPAVPLGSPLVADVAANAVALTPQPYGDLPFYAMQGTLVQETLVGEDVADRILLHCVPRGAETWEALLDLVVVGGVERPVERATVSAPGGVPIRWDVFAGEAA